MISSSELMQPCPWKVGRLGSYAFRTAKVAELTQYIPAAELQKRILFDTQRHDERYKLRPLQDVKTTDIWKQLQQWLPPTVSPITYGRFAVISDIPPNGSVCILEQYSERFRGFRSTIQAFVINIKDPTDPFWYSVIFLDSDYYHPATLPRGQVQVSLLGDYPRYSKILHRVLSQRYVTYLVMDELVQIWWDATLIAMLDFHKKLVLVNTHLSYKGSAMPVFSAHGDYYVGLVPNRASPPEEDHSVMCYLISPEGIDLEYYTKYQGAEQ